MFKYNGKEQPATTVSRGSKYIAAPKSSTVMSTVTTSGNMSTIGEKLSDDGTDYGSPMEKDIQVRKSAVSCGQHVYHVTYSCLEIIYKWISR